MKVVGECMRQGHKEEEEEEEEEVTNLFAYCEVTGFSTLPHPISVVY